MKSDKLLRFLKVLKIQNIDDFDLEFEMLTRDRFNDKQWNMILVKDSPWNYELLRQFQDSLVNLNFVYTLRFSYRNRPTYTDVINLFHDWFQSIYHIPSNLNINGDIQDHIVFSFDSNEEKDKNEAIISDFKDFLRFINYEFSVTSCLKEKADKILFKSNEKDLKIDLKELENIDKNILNEVENERKELNKLVEDSLIEEMRANALIMAKEREKMRIYKRGNYSFVDTIDSINENSGNVDFSCKVFVCEKKEFAGKTRLNIGVFDSLGGAIYVNIYQGGTLRSEIVNELVFGCNVRIRGAAYLDEFSKQITIKGHYVDLLPPDEIVPDEGETRVELHLHTNMSAMDAPSKIMNYCLKAKSLGHKALAITDHAVVQGFPDAQKAAKKTGIKMLYGCEFYMVDDKQTYVTNPCNAQLSNATYVVLDLETTGLSCKYNRIIEFGAVKVVQGSVVSHVDYLINPLCKIPKKITDITNINDDMVKDKPTFREVMDKIVEFIGDAILVTHNAVFDISFLQESLKKEGHAPLTNPTVDTLALSRYLFPEAKKHSLGSLCRNMDVVYDEDSAHRADYDANVLNDVWQPMIVKLSKDNPNLTHADLAKLETPINLLKHIMPNHIVALAKDKVGLKALYELVSKSHIDFLADVPKIPRSELSKYRDHLLLGSACFNGEVFRTARYYNEEVLKKVMSFYDYIEIQPLENYSFLVNMGDLSGDEVKTYIKDIVKYGKEINKLVVATGDVHYCDKTDKIFRDVYISAKGLGGVNHPLNPYSRNSMEQFENPDQHFRSTKEMLECMSFLGEDIAREVVVKNSNIIADQIESIVPVPNDKLYTPTIENCDKMLKDMCYENAHKLYGNPLPESIQNRLDIELNGIIGNGYSVIYYIAHKIIKKANEDGYIVGSRGSVGSSFAATMAGVTEVNPLPPHYLCPHCHHLEWTSESYPEYRSGYDLPEKKCPDCGKAMIHDGQNIPFETFLGFKAEKVPDIDLNFPGDYQAIAHNYTKVLLGSDNVFRAGTIETVAEKTAFGYARGYIERKLLNSGNSKEEVEKLLNNYPKAKIGYLASGCIDVKRTTGQHPGGIVVVPTDHVVYDFTPVQFPADEPDSAWKTTHFDFHSIHDTILKLDLLGHVDPLALRMMCRLTGIKMEDIPMNDKKVLSLFSSGEALGMKEDYMHNKTGALGIPEFGTENTRKVLEVTNPKLFSDLVIISGISHGTNVWAGNAETLIKDGIATLQEVIGCRDDIMTYLIDKGISSDNAFAIMEDVRHGKGLKESQIEIMKANNVPDYYIDSCNKIAYLFPKGHAVAYVTMAIRVGYFKIYYPLEFYATFFSVRSKQFDIIPMIKGKDAVIDRLNELKLKSKSRSEKISPKESEQLKTLTISLEMLQRGYKFSNIDLYKSDATNFIVDYENKCLVPPFITLDGLGENNAVTIIEARKEGAFISKEDLLRRTKITTTNVKDLTNMGVLDGLDDNDQLTLF